MDWGPQQLEALARIRAWLADKRAPQVFYLAGYAGVGKTEISKEIGTEVAGVKYAAFTGKAAAVMQQKGCEGAQTIHRLIYELDGRATDRRANGQPVFNLSMQSELVGASLAIIDESSMVTTDMARDLLSFHTKVLVLGDPAQLPPVGEGTGYFTSNPDYLLTEIHRQAENDPIIALSRTVREGGLLRYGDYGQSRVIRRKEVTATMARQADQILCGKNSTRRETNDRLRKLLGRDGLFKPQDKIVCTKNDYGLGLFNGSIWVVESVDFQDAQETIMTIRGTDPGSEKLEITVTATNAVLLGTEKDLSREEARDHQFFDFAYALTVHKAQGSQWDDVLVLDEGYIFKADAARWRYTAITRAAKRVVVAI